MPLVQIIEHILTYAANRTQEKRRQRDIPVEAPTVALPQGHIVLGKRLPIGPDLVTLSPEARMRHLYALGGTGCGKTNLLLNLITSDIEASRTFCVIDLRGDLVDRILLRLAHDSEPERMAERLVLLDLRQEEYAVGFNPLAGSGDPGSRAFHLLGILRQQSDSWGIQLEETLRNCLLALAETGWSLLEIEPLLSHAGFRRQVMAGVSDSYVRAFFTRYDKLSEEKQTGWRLPVLNKVSPLLALPQLRRTFGQRTGLDFRSRLDRTPGQIILIALAVDRLHEAAHLAGGLLLSSLQTAIMARVDQPESSRIPVHLYVDEFETMATEQFHAIIAEGRRFGLGLCLSHQNLGQLPGSLRQVLLNNVQTQLYFQTGAGDAADLAREIVAPQTADEIRQTLMTQGVGEAYLVRRGQEATRLRVPLSADPRVSVAQAQALRTAALRRWGQSKAEIERELAEREHKLQYGDILPAETVAMPAETTEQDEPPKPGKRAVTKPPVTKTPVTKTQAANTSAATAKVSKTAIPKTASPNATTSKATTSKDIPNDHSGHYDESSPRPAEAGPGYEVRHVPGPSPFIPPHAGSQAKDLAGSSEPRSRRKRTRNPD